MLRYPIFDFDGDDLMVYETFDDHWNLLESYDLDVGIAFDSDGRIITRSEAGKDRVTLSDSGAEPDPERLRGMLLHALQVRGQLWPAESPLDCLTTGAVAWERSWHLRRRRFSLGKTLSSAARFLHLKKPRSP